MMNDKKVAQRPKFSTFVNTEFVRRSIMNALQDPNRVQRFTSGIVSAVSANPDLQDCDPGTVLSGALLGEGLMLSPSPQLGQYFLVPFKDRKNDRSVATFILGYKGYIQLAIRSGQYKNINVVAIKKGELVNYNPLTEDVVINPIQDELAREAAETVGYYACFEYLNGFFKSLYWSKEKMQQHALRYSKGYAAKKGYTFWEKDFDSMAIKTMIRQLLSKWGVLSVEMQTAIEKDGAIIGASGAAEFPNGADINDIADDYTTVVPDDDNVEQEAPADNKYLLENTNSQPTMSLDQI